MLDGMRSDDLVPTARLAGQWRATGGETLALTVTSGPDRGKRLPLRPGVSRVGKAPDCQLVLIDSTVSKHHLEISFEGALIELRDSGSKNGSFYRGARFTSLLVAPGAVIRLGRTELVLAELSREETVDLEQLGRLHGHSRAMRRLYLQLQRFGATAIPLLITGETGSGKELAAEAAHLASPRRDGPLVVCDLAAISPSLIESELFGHVRGAFTGADHDRPGAFELARGGTIFLDEIGELDLALQPRLLRVLDTGQVKRVGDSRYRNVDVRVIAATHRDLTAAVAARQFREDLYYRLAAATVTVPPLRERLDDLPLLAERILAELARRGGRRLDLAPQALAQLSAHDWPGNVRQLRNVLEGAVIAAEGSCVTRVSLPAPAAPPRPPPPPPPAAPPLTAELDLEVSFKRAKQRLVDGWERDYFIALLRRCAGNVTLAARLAHLDRVHFHRLLRKHELSRADSADRIPATGK